MYTSSYLLIPSASSFTSLAVADEFVIQGTTLSFSLVDKNNPDSYVSGVLEANEITGYTAWNPTSDPQNEKDVDFDSLETQPYHVAKVEDFSEVLALKGQPFLLTESQCARLNQLLSWHFEEEKLNELKGMVA